MMPDGLAATICSIAVGVVALSVAAAICARILRRPASSANGARECCATTEFREAFAAHRRACDQKLEALLKTLESLEASLPARDEPRPQESLNLSTRARALQLLRAGMSPDTAAVNLGMPTRDVRLLATVSRLLTSG